MLRTILNAFSVADIRKKLAFTAAMLALYRLGAYIPAPGVDANAVKEISENFGGSGVLGFLNLFSGGSLSRLSLFALGIMPYITASIILQLLVVVIPRLEALKKEGQSGQTKITQYTRYLTLGLAILQATGIVALARSGNLLQGCTEPLLHSNGTATFLTMVVTMTAGTTVIMWLGELITERGIGNGMSLLIFTQVVSGFPSSLWSVQKSKGWWVFGLVIVIGLVIIAAVIFVEQAQRRIPVQYARRMVGRKMFGGSSTYIPLKVNQAGVIPVIFASSLLYLPAMVSQFNQNGTATFLTMVVTMTAGTTVIM
ncbi:MAG: preprotein translocase subunit SecY, partial [Solirubrobacterales bacterium]